MTIRVLETIRGEALLLRTAYQREGFTYALRKGTIYAARWPIDIFSTFYYRHLRRPRPTFTFQRQAYNYFYHSYNNTTWKNERSLEIPITRKIVEEYRGKRILEVGNVLCHYFPCHHDVVDLHEKYSDFTFGVQDDPQVCNTMAKMGYKMFLMRNGRDFDNHLS